MILNDSRVLVFNVKYINETKSNFYSFKQIEFLDEKKILKLT